MSGLDEKVAAFLDGQAAGVLATIRPDGKPHQSVVYFARDGERLLISTLAGRLKARDVERTGWASLCVHGTEPPYPSATLTGPARILTEGIGPGTALVMQSMTAAAEPPEPQTDEALAGVGRVLLEIEIERVGPTSYLD